MAVESSATSERRFVLDASAVLRLLLDGSPLVDEAVATAACAAPDLIRLEVANGLVRQVRAGNVERRRGVRLLELFFELPIEIASSARLVLPALAVALEPGLTAYDALYEVLAGERDAVLLTADKRLARVATRAELVD